MPNFAKKGKRLEDEVKKIIENIIADRIGVKVLQRSSLPGASAYWTPDIIMAAELLLYPGQYSLYLAIVECKNISEGVHPATYWTHMSRAYMELNDLRLSIDLGSPKFFLIVNRYPLKSESPKLDYTSIFEKIGVKMVNINEDQERTVFEEQIRALLKEGSFEGQVHELEEILRKYRKKS